MKIINSEKPFHTSCRVMYSKDTERAAVFMYSRRRLRMRVWTDADLPSQRKRTKLAKTRYFQSVSRRVSRNQKRLRGLSLGRPNQDCDVIERRDRRYLRNEKR